MTAHRPSMRRNLAIIIAAMGLLVLVLTYVSGEIYCHLALETQRQTHTDYMRAEMNKLRVGFEADVRALAQRMQNDPTLAKAAAARQNGILGRQLDGLYQFTSAASLGVPLSRLYVLDDKFAVQAVSSLGDDGLLEPPCGSILARVVPMLERTRGTRACMAGKRTFYVAAVSLGAPARGYLYVVGDLGASIVNIERHLGTPMRLSRAEGEVIYQSPRWPTAEQLSVHVVATHQFFAAGPQAVALQLDIAKDMTSFYDRLTNLRYLVLITVTFVCALAILFALYALEQTAIKPLRMLTTQLQRIRQDKRNLGEQVTVKGNAEIAELAEGFNEMTARLRELYESLERMAFTDSLTGLPNRSLFHDRLQQAILTAKREVKPFALLMMDLDRFKDINDTLGHHIGDELLSQVAQRLRSKLRASDTVARMGGDEFAVLLPAVDAKHAGMAARMLLQALRSPFTVEEHTLNVGASIGIALYPENGVDASILMQRADVAMYSAKAAGSGFAFYDPEADQNYPTRLALLSDLREAVEREQFELYYQPIVSLENNRVTGIEALARWRHPREGILLPDSFIPLLEQSGLIRGLMPWVVSEALKRAHALQLAGSPLTVSINLSMRDLQDPYIAESFAEQLEAYQVAAGSIVLEITESAVMTDAPRTLELLSRLSAMGLKIAIDDFGTGYSSLTYLKKLPVNTLKIDKSFVIGMTSDENDAAIVRTSIDLAHNLGLKVVAEGVETEPVLRQLKALGCDLAQGHYMGRPLCEAELEDWLAQSSWGIRDVGAGAESLEKQLKAR